VATWDTAQLLSEIRDAAQAPSSSSTAPGWTDADLLRRANQALFSSLVAEVMAAHGEHFVTDYDTTMTVGGTSGYRIPTRAAFNKLRDVVRVDSDGKPHNLTELKLEELPGKDLDLPGTPTHYYIQRNKVYPWPIPETAETLRLKVMRRPNRLVASSTAVVGIVSAVSFSIPVAVTLTASKPSTFTAGVRVDFIQGRPPFDTFSDDVAINTASGTSVTFASGAVPSELAAGDYICLAGEAPVVQLPVEFFGPLAERVARKLLRGTDGMGFEEIGEDLAQVTGAVASGVRKRNDGEEDIIVGNSFFP
jgi:hypothetical protein